MRETLFPTLALFASLSTLICCALPALLVTIGAGAALAGLVSNVPGLVWFTEHKDTVFILAGIMIGLSGLLRWKSRNAPCPVDPEQAKACTRLRKISLIIWILSATLYVIGVFFAYFAASLLS